MEGRIPPHSIDAEKSVLGAALLSKDALFDVVEVTRPEDFYDENHKEIFRAILDLHRRNAPVDALTVSEELKKRNSLNMVGGRAYIASLSAQLLPPPMPWNTPKLLRKWLLSEELYRQPTI